MKKYLIILLSFFLFQINVYADEIHIYNQEDLNTYLEQKGTNLIDDYLWFYNQDEVVFPNDLYIVNGGRLYIQLPSSSGSINFNNSTFLIGDGDVIVKSVDNQYNRKLYNLVVYGSSSISDDYINGNRDYNPIIGNSKHKGSFYCILFHTQNLHFENIEINNAFYPDGHIFDLAGSKNISFNNVVNRGSAIPKKYNEDYLTKLFDKNAHLILTEAIQIDSANHGALGSVTLNDPTHPEYKIWYGHKYDSIASSYITIKNSRITSYSGPTGYGLINGIVDNHQSWGATIGSHSTSSHQGFGNIIIDNVELEDTIRINKVLNEVAPIKFLTVANIELKGNRENSILNSIIRNQTSISVNDTKFINTKTFGYITGSGMRSNKSTYEVWFDDDLDPDNNRVDKTVIQDRNGHIISERDGYSPEEPFVNDLIFHSNKLENNILTRIYYRPDETEINPLNVKFIDEPFISYIETINQNETIKNMSNKVIILLSIVALMVGYFLLYLQWSYMKSLTKNKKD